MEVINQSALRVDRQLLVITHLTQLLSYIIGFGGLITPLIIWLSSKDRVEGMDEHGKAIVNFQLESYFIFYNQHSSYSIAWAGNTRYHWSGCPWLCAAHCKCSKG